CFYSSEITPEFAFVDFEFTNLGRNTLILISGAIVEKHQTGFITKLEGRALVLNENRAVSTQKWNRMVHHMVNIFKHKKQTLFPILAEIHDSDHSTKPNLTNDEIRKQFINYDAIVLWECSTECST
ncbi:MAG: hypothetical protein ACRYE7_00235, partial [Janthinobacterium lividum]